MTLWGAELSDKEKAQSCEYINMGYLNLASCDALGQAASFQLQWSTHRVQKIRKDKRLYKTA